jgi:diguanylate cyclase
MQSVDRSFSIAVRAIELMKTHCNSASPRSYEIWYAFASDSHQQLNAGVKASLARNGRLSCRDIEALYSAHLSSERLLAETERVGAGVADKIGRVTNMIAAALDAADQYSRSLEHLVGEHGPLGHQDRPPREILEALLGTTKEVAATNRDLEARIRQSHSEIDHLRASLDTVRHQSITDPLTGVANRRHFEASLAAARDWAASSGESLALVLIDIDHFKQFNDLHGHVTGDQVLRLVGAAMRDAIKGGATLARFGGEEFAVILPDRSLAEAVNAAEAIRQSIDGKELRKRSSGVSLGRVTISLGVVTLQAKETATALLQRADRCLYAAKRAGRNRTISQRDLVRPSMQVA